MGICHQGSFRLHFELWGFEVFSWLVGFWVFLIMMTQSFTGWMETMHNSHFCVTLNDTATRSIE